MIVFYNRIMRVVYEIEVLFEFCFNSPIAMVSFGLYGGRVESFESLIIGSITKDFNKIAPPIKKIKTTTIITTTLITFRLLFLALSCFSRKSNVSTPLNVDIFSEK